MGELTALPQMLELDSGLGMEQVDNREGRDG